MKKIYEAVHSKFHSKHEETTHESYKYIKKQVLGVLKWMSEGEHVQVQCNNASGDWSIFFIEYSGGIFTIKEDLLPHPIIEYNQLINKFTIIDYMRVLTIFKNMSI